MYPITIIINFFWLFVGRGCLVHLPVELFRTNLTRPGKRLWMEFIESILKKERVKDDSEFERIVLSIDNFTKFLDDFNRKG